MTTQEVRRATNMELFVVMEKMSESFGDFVKRNNMTMSFNISTSEDGSKVLTIKVEDKDEQSGIQGVYKTPRAEA